MKSRIAATIFFITALSVSAQRLSMVGILPFEASGGASAEDAALATRMVIAELGSWGTMTVLSGAGDGEYIVKGQVSRQNNQIVLSAATTEARTGGCSITRGRRRRPWGKFPPRRFASK